MSLQPQSLIPIPTQTQQVAQAAFPKGNLYLKMRDELGTLYEDQDFAGLFPKRGQPALAPWRLALITIFQFVENLSDRQAAEQVRARIDWKYALSLELTDSGFDYSVLSEFRTRLVQGAVEQQLFEIILNQFKAKGLVKAGGKQRTDSTHILASVRELNRTEGLAETLRAVLNAVAVVAPNWLKTQVGPGWFERYSHRVEEYRLPKGVEARKAYAELVGNDGVHLLQAIYNETDGLGEALRAIEAVEGLRQMWVQHFYFEEGQLHLREIKDLPPTRLRIESPYDIEARYSEKRTTKWTGYKVHLSESCDENQPHLITNVETTQAQVPDVVMTEPIHTNLAKRELLPQEHLVDMGYTNMNLFFTAKQEHQIELIGPLRTNTGWQSSAKNGFGADHFEVDWASQKVKCPVGKFNKSWTEAKDVEGEKVIHIKFSPTDCGSCPQQSLCTRSASGRREITLRPQAQYEALQKLRQYQKTSEFQERYSLRAGVESTLSQSLKVFGLRECRYRGLAKTRLQHWASATAINVVRVGQWLKEDHCEATLNPDLNGRRTRPSQFGALAWVAA